MENYDRGDDGGDNDVNEGKKDDDNADFGSGYDGLIFDPIATSWSRLGITEEDWETMNMVLRPRHHMYLCVGIYLPYKYPINTKVNMCYKLLYAKTGVLDFCC